MFRARFPRQWLQDKPTMDAIEIFSGQRPKRFPWVNLSQDQADDWAEDSRAIERSYFRRHPSYTIEVSVYDEVKAPPKKNGQRHAQGNRLRHRNVIGINYWDRKIPFDTELQVDGPEWAKLQRCLFENKPNVNILLDNASGPQIVFAVVKLIERTPRPTGALIEQRVRGGVVPSHKHLDVYWSEQGFLPKGQEQSEGDCLPRAVLYALKESFDKNTKKTQKLLDIEHILDVCQSDAEMSPLQLTPFLQKYHITCVVYDTRGLVLWAYHPESRNKKMASRLDLLLHNKHVTLLNHDLKSLQTRSSQTVSEMKRPSKHFHHGTLDAAAKTFAAYDTLREHIKSVSAYERLYYMPAEDEPDLDVVFFRLAKELNIEPKLKLSSTLAIKELVFDLPGLQASVIKTDVQLKTLKVLVDAAFSPHLKSAYSSTLQRAIIEMKRGPLRKRFGDVPMEAHKIDIVRFYSSVAAKLEKIPVFNSLDDLVAYDGSPIQDFTMYIIESGSNYILANKRYNLVSGFTVRALAVTPLAMCIPSNIETNPLRAVLKTLYKDPTNPDLKTAVNIVVGMAGKTVNRTIEAHFTTDLTEAHHFTTVDHPPVPFQHGYLTVAASEETELVDGFFPLQFMVYDLARLELSRLHGMLSQHTRVFGISTDCFFVESIPDINLHTGPKTYESLGSLQYEGVGKTPFQEAVIEDNEMPVVIQRPVYNYGIIQSNTFIGGFAGSGKTFRASEFMGCLKTQPVLSTKSLYVCYSNEMMNTEMARTHNADYISYCTLLGEVVNDDGEVRKSRKGAFDLSQYTHILLDELCLQPPSSFVKIVKHLEGRGLSILATGDYDQNSTQNFNNIDREAFYENSLWRIFPNRVYLEKSERVNLADEVILKGMLRDFKAGVPVSTVLQKAINAGHLKTTTDYIAFNRHICYMNEWCAKVEESYGARPPVMKRLKHDSKKSDVLALAQKHGHDIQVDGNIRFIEHEGKRIQYLTRKAKYDVRYVTLKGKTMVGVGTDLYEYTDFVGIHATTGHGCQGETIKTPFCIMGFDHFYADWRWVWTAITRCARLTDVHLYIGDTLKKEKPRNVAAKLLSYEQTDAAKGHSFDLTEQWVTDTLRKQRNFCGHCGKVMTLDYKKDDMQQWSVDRRDNSQGHLQSNCWIIHLSCNHSLAPKTSRR